MWYLLLLPTLLFADVEKAPAAQLQTSAAAQRATVELRLRPELAAPIVASAPESELTPTAISTGVVTDGASWMKVQREATFFGYVEKASISKDLEILPGANVYETPEKGALLLSVEDPARVRLLEVDRMGKVQVKGPTTLYYPVGLSGVEKTDVAMEAAPQVEVAAISDASDAQAASMAQPVQQKRVPQYASGTMSPADAKLRTIEGELRKGNPLLGSKLYLVDIHGRLVARIDPNSPIDRMTLQRYLGQKAIFVGEMEDHNGSLYMKVRSVRLQ